MKVILRVLSYIKRFWHWEVAAYLCTLGITAARLLTPQIMRNVVDLGIEGGDMVVLTRSVLALLGITAAIGLLRFGESYLSETVSQGAAFDMRNQVYNKLQSLSFSFHDQAQGGQLLSRTTSDVERLRRFTGRGFIRLTESIVLIIGTTIIMLSTSTRLALISLSVMPIIAVFMRWYVERMHPTFHARQDQMAVMTARLEQNLYGVSVVRGFAQEEAEKGRFGKENNRIFEISQYIARLGSTSMPLVIFLASISTVLVLWLGGRMVIQGTLTLGQLVAFNAYLMQLIGPVRRLGFMITMMSESHASALRVFEILDTESEVVNLPDAEPLGDIAGHVSFDHVSFEYLPGATVLRDVSFDVPAGQVVALLGPTGSGKSTITNLIPRFYDVSEGAIRVDDQDIREVTIESLRSQIGMVMQETQLFGSTIRENLAFGRPDASEEDIVAAAKASAAHEFILGFADGYDTEVGERGVTLSGGQRQRIAIARALLLDPRILILDDATSSVDTETELAIQAALKRLTAGRTTFVIAQRVSTVRDANLIMVVDRGKLVASGTHSELIRQSGIYADIYYRQLKQDTTEEARS